MLYKVNVNILMFTIKKFLSFHGVFHCKPTCSVHVHVKPTIIIMYDSILDCMNLWDNDKTYEKHSIQV